DGVDVQPLERDGIAVAVPKLVRTEVQDPPREIEPGLDLRPRVDPDPAQHLVAEVLLPQGLARAEEHETQQQRPNEDAAARARGAVHCSPGPFGHGETPARGRVRAIARTTRPASTP